MVRDRRANWKQSLAVLRAAKAAGARITKTSIMLGCGEQPQEVLEAMQILRDAGKPPASFRVGRLALHGCAHIVCVISIAAVCTIVWEWYHRRRLFLQQALET